MIETGESEMIFQKAILEQGRGYVLDTLAEIRERRDAGGLQSPRCGQGTRCVLCRELHSERAGAQPDGFNTRPPCWFEFVLSLVLCVCWAAVMELAGPTFPPRPFSLLPSFSLPACV